MNKSPGRKSRRSQSPARNAEKKKSNKEGKKSRSRSRGRPSDKTKSSPSKPKRSPGRSKAIKQSKTPKIVSEKGPTPKREEKDSVRNSFSRFDNLSSETVITLRRSNRQINAVKEAEIVDEVNDILKKNNFDIPKPEEKRVEKPQKAKDFGGLLGVFLLIPLMPTIVFLLNLACNSTNCLMKGFIVPLSWKKYFDLEATYYYLIFLATQMLLSSLPIGFHAHSTSGKYVTLTYRCNGLINCLVTLGAIYGLNRVGWFDPSIVVNRSLQMLVVAVGVALIISLGLHLTSQKTVYNNFLYDFWIGQRVSPHYHSFDLKVALIRASLIATITHNCILLFIETRGKSNYSQFGTSAIVACVLQILYSADFLIFESNYLDSFTVRHEAAGYMLIMSLMLYPFFVTVLPKYVFFNKVNNSFYVIGAVILLYCLGYLIFRLSNAQKASFKKISYPILMSGVEVIEGLDGQRLLAGGLWGWVRHPNHLGAALMSFSLGGLALGGPPHWAPYFAPLITPLLLAHKAKRDSTSCASRYGSAYIHYSSKVKKEILPGVF